MCWPHLDDQARARLTLLLRQDYLGRNELTGEIAQLFGDALPEAHMIIVAHVAHHGNGRTQNPKTDAEKTAPRRRRH